MKQLYKHVLFDLDGTVYDTQKANMSALYDVLKHYNPDTTETVDSLSRYMGSSVEQIREELGLEHTRFEQMCGMWIERLLSYSDLIKPFDGVMEVIRNLKERGIHMGIITSRQSRFSTAAGGIISAFPKELEPYMDICIAADSVEHPKPAPDSIRKYIAVTGAKREEILYIGDTENDRLCALNSGVDFGLAVWGCALLRSLKCDHYFMTPWDIVSAVFSEDSLNYQVYRFAKEIQAIGQIGLAYTQNVFDRERFERLRELSCEMLSSLTDEPVEKVRNVICMDKGYITPKIDTRAAVFDEQGRIMLVQEARNGKWSLPGGWCDESETIRSNTLKEVYEEAGMQVHPVRFVGILDKDRWNSSKQPFHILAAFTVCRAGDGEFAENSETLCRRFFALEDIPVESLRTGTTTIEQIKLCFEAYKSEHWIPLID